MNQDLISRLKACKLPGTMGLQFRENPSAIQIVTPVGFVSPPLWVFFDTDEAPGTALFIVRGLKALADNAQSTTKLRTILGGWRIDVIGNYGEVPSQHDSPTIAQAVAEALIVTFGGNP